MKHLPAILFIAAAVLCGSGSAPAQAAPILDFAVRVGCDFQQPERGLMDLHFLQGSTPLVLAMPKAGNTALTPDADTSVRMVIGPSETGSIYAVRTNYAIAGGGYAIDWPTIGTNSSGQAWFYTLLFDREGKTYWSGSGALYIDASTYTGPDGVDWIEYTTPNVGWTNLSITGTGNAITGATAAADTLTLQRGEIESGGSGFPLTNNADMAKYSLTNGLTVQATNGQFKTLAVSGGNTTLGALTAGNTTIQGNLTVTGTTYNITTVNISTNYYVGVSTTYVDEVRYSTNYTYTYVYTNIVSTNTVNTYVDVGGTWDASNSAWAAFPHFVDTASGNLVGIGTWDFTGATLIGLPAQGVTNIGSSMTGNGLETALDVDWGTATTTAMTNIDWASFDGGITNIGDGLTGDGLANALEVERWADVEEMLENQTNVVSVAGGPSAYTVGRFPVWDGNTWVQSEYVPASSTGAVSSVNLMVGHIAIAGFGGTSVSTDTNTSTITIGSTSTNEVRAIRDEAFRPYTTLGLSGGTALVTRTSGRWLMIEADNGVVTLDVDAASYTNALEAIQHNVMWIRGTNETYSIVTNNIANSAYIDCPVSTTNHFLLEKRPGWPRFQIWQDFR